jgi:bifunctional non-homologous end joining protein LigD
MKRAAPARAQENIDVGGVSLSHPTHRISAELRISKLELAEYYLAVAEHMLPTAAGRPLTVVRCPRGHAGRCFIQKHFTEQGLSGVELVDIEESGGTKGSYAVLTHGQGLVQLVQLGTLEIHHWATHADRLERPDQLIVDLDPGERISWVQLRDAAKEVKDRLERAGLNSFVRTTGGSGLHVLVPLAPQYSWSEVRAFARALAEAMQADSPDRYIAAADKTRRAGKIYVDYLRNARGATAIANYSTRASRGIPVAVPIGWEELQRISGSDHYQVASVRRRLQHIDRSPWYEFTRLQQKLPS